MNKGRTHYEQVPLTFVRKLLEAEDVRSETLPRKLRLPDGKLPEDALLAAGRSERVGGQS